MSNRRREAPFVLRNGFEFDNVPLEVVLRALVAILFVAK